MGTRWVLLRFLLRPKPVFVFMVALDDVNALVAAAVPPARSGAGSRFARSAATSVEALCVLRT